MHYWGSSSDIAATIKQSKGRVILSQYDTLYLNRGQGYIYGNQFSPYINWMKVYSDFQPQPAGVEAGRILGGEACLWGEVSN